MLASFGSVYHALVGPAHAQEAQGATTPTDAAPTVVVTGVQVLSVTTGGPRYMLGARYKF